jgi:hypothetical protein
LHPQILPDNSAYVKRGNFASTIPLLTTLVHQSHYRKVSEDQTKSTLETLARQIESLATEMRSGFAAVAARLSAIENQLENMDIRLDSIESFSHLTRSEVLSLRAYLKSFVRDEDLKGRPTGLASGSEPQERSEKRG